MNIYFCDSCGERYSDQEVVAGTASNPAAQNLCGECRKKAAPAATPRTSADISGPIIIMPAVARARPSTARITPVRRNADEAQSAVPSRGSKSNMMIYAGVAGAAGAIALAFVLTSGNSKRTTAQSTPAQIKTNPAEPTTQPEPVKDDTVRPETGHAEPAKNAPAVHPASKPSTHASASTSNPAAARANALEELSQIIAKLREINPSYDGKEAHKITGGHVTTLSILADTLVDLAPLHDLSTLEELILHSSTERSRLDNLAPLAGLKLTSLTVTNAAISSLEPLSGIPLVTLDITGDPITSLAPLKGMALRDLTMNSAHITDISPLQGMPLEKLNIGYSKTPDLLALKGMPLNTLVLYNCTNVKDISPLQGMPLKHLSVHGTNVSDLSPIRGMQLTILQVSSSKVTDLSPAAGMPLATVELGQTKVKDLSPLKGCPLTFLNLTGSAVEDLSPIEGMAALWKLTMQGTQIKNLSLLKTLPSLTDVQVDLKTQEEVELLRSLPKLKMINMKPAHEILDNWKPPAAKK